MKWRLVGGEKVPDDFRSLIQADNGGTVLYALVLNERIGIAQAFLFMVMEQYILVREVAYHSPTEIFHLIVCQLIFEFDNQ